MERPFGQLQWGGIEGACHDVSRDAKPILNTSNGMTLRVHVMKRRVMQTHFEHFRWCDIEVHGMLC